MGFVEVVLRPEVGWLAGGGMIALAGLLLFLAPRDRVLRAFSVFLVVRGTANLPFVVPHIGAHVDNLRVIVLPFIALWFLIEYHFVARLRRRSTFVLPMLGVMATCAAIVYFQIITVPLPPWLHIVNALFPARFFAYALVALVLAQDALRHADPDRRWPLLLVSCAFALNPLHHIAVTLQGQGLDGIFIDWYQGIYWIPHTMILFALATLVATAGTLSVAMMRRRDPRLSRQVLAYQGTLLLVLVIFLYHAWRIGTPFDYALPAAVAWDRVWTLPVPFVVGYVLLRHRLFDLDLRFKSSLPNILILGLISAVFFLAEETLEGLVPVNGTLLGLLSAGLVALAFVPLQRLARRAIDRLMPGVAPTEDYLRHRKLDVYRTAVETALVDGHFGTKDRRILDVLRSQLQIQDESAARVETEVRERLGLAAGPEPRAAPGQPMA